MAHTIAILSVIPRLSYHLRMQLPNLTIFDVAPDKNDTLSKLNDADILVTDCDLFVPYLDKLQSLKWVQTTWAGVEALTPRLKDTKINYVVTRFSDGAFGLAMAEYVVAHIFNFERNQKQQYENQRNRQWRKDGKISDHRLICDLSVGVLGLGNIGKSIAQQLKAFGANVWGITRGQLKEKLDYLDQHRTIEFLPEMLKQCDYIVNVLPSTPNTLGLLNGDMLQNCKDRGSVFINIGRGSVIKEADLLNALQQKWISGAILDVFEKEPLPKDSKLWTLPQVTISPHISGVTRSQDVARFFAENYQKFAKGENLLNVINLKEGY
ncbi:PREDICTED: glyoxylate/hydroxypyruvate reductase A-like [Dufourea novaeangliae]|uniref:Glyoxylate/hydroxypyruvate reductase A n=1 Tax=Dufourea novaeangliae TaxID=178035 RepID=A0A154P1T8_DUFNO|nr:PREDICTED: glyoxylate/hydroxypyruvate reductase A-like [Dufourea novaeangliae]KZC05803.1 Glyoxylate/hydroxypyruvate reductase A [Dufourea novaeangliae]